MSNATQINELGVRINFPEWARFNLDFLTAEGVVLFQYLAFHSASNAWWTHSIRAIENELGIKRKRLETLTDLLKEKGILETQIVDGPNKIKITAYRVNFSNLTKLETLKLIYRDIDKDGKPIDLTETLNGWKKLAQTQPKTGKTAYAERQEKTRLSYVKPFVHELQQLHQDRQRIINNSIKEGKRSIGFLTFSPKQVGKVRKAIEYIKNYNGYTEAEANRMIRNAFLAFCDQLIKVQLGRESDLLHEDLKSPIDYFLAYQSSEESEGQGYGNIYTFSNYFASVYQGG